MLSRWGFVLLLGNLTWISLLVCFLFMLQVNEELTV